MTYVDFVSLRVGFVNCRCDHSKSIETPFECEEDIWIFIC